MSVEGATGAEDGTRNSAGCTEQPEQVKSWKQLGELIVEGKKFKNVTASTVRVKTVFAEGANTP